MIYNIIEHFFRLPWKNVFIYSWSPEDSFNIVFHKNILPWISTPTTIPHPTVTSTPRTLNEAFASLKVKKKKIRTRNTAHDACLSICLSICNHIDVQCIRSSIWAASTPWSPCFLLSQHLLNHGEFCGLFVIIYELENTCM